MTKTMWSSAVKYLVSAEARQLELKGKVIWSKDLLGLQDKILQKINLSMSLYACFSVFNILRTNVIQTQHLLFPHVYRMAEASGHF